MRVAIKRSGGTTEYEVPEYEYAVTVMQILDYIYEELDHSLAYFRHSACCQGVCARCAVKANGKNVLACVEKVEPGTAVLTLEPAGNRVLRDLVLE
jgi:succinate dehydrogenase/fumarate reductase-like Fe-S protein